MLRTIGQSLKSRESLWLISTLVVQYCLMQVTFLKVLPITNGFFLIWDRMAKEATLYRDFYFPLPPVALFVEGTIPNLFENPQVAEQYLQGAKWLAVSWLLFLVIQKFSRSAPVTFVGSTLALTAYLCSPGNITAGYLELAWLFLLAAILFAIKTFEGQKKTLHPFLFGGFLSLAFLTKQSALVAVAVLVTTYLVLFVRSGAFNSNYKQHAALLLGLATPITLLVVFGLTSESLEPAVQQIFGGGGKDPGSGNWFWWGLASLAPTSSILPWLEIGIFAIALGLMPRTPAASSSNQRVILAGVASVFLGLAVLAFIGLDLLRQPYSGPLATVVVLLVGLISWALFKALTYENLLPPALRVLERIWALPALAALFCAVLVYLGSYRMARFDGGAQAWLSSNLGNINALGAFTTALGVLWGIATLFRRDFQAERLATSYLIVAGSFGFAVMNAASGGLSIETWLLPIPFAVSWLWTRISAQLQGTIASVVAASLILIPISTFASGQSNLPYSWWGLSTASINEPRRLGAEISPSGFHLSDSDSSMYRGVRTTTSKVLEQLGVETPILLGPNTAGIAAGLIGDVSIYKTTCVILWFDICPPDTAEQDARKIMNDPPKIIIWNFAPDFVIAGHEQGFNRGKVSGISVVQNWIDKEFVEGRYANRFVRVMGDGSDKWVLRVLVRQEP